jgi:hypothetical protein
MQKAIMLGNYNLTCEHCPFFPMVNGNCKNYFCDEIITTLRRELEGCRKKEKQ